MKITTIKTINNLKRFSLTFGLALTLPLVITNKESLFAQTVISQYKNTQGITSSFTETPPTGRVIDIIAPTTTNTSLPITNKPPVSTNNLNIPPLPTKQPVRDTILINAKPTPPAPNPIGNAIASNRTLPTPPVISEPYRKNEQNNPTDEINYPISNNSITSNNNAIQIKPSNETPSPLTTAPRYGNSDIQRRNLADILLVAPNASNTSPPPGFNSTNTVTNRNNTQAYNNRSTQYKVIVESKNSYQESQIRSFYPGAFRTTYKGRSMMQVGVFSTKQSADQVLQSLRNAGLNALISY
jgi:hypothetical protein